MPWDTTVIAWGSTVMVWEGTVMASKCLSRRFLHGFSRFGSKPRPSVVKKRQLGGIRTRNPCLLTRKSRLGRHT